MSEKLGDSTTKKLTTGRLYFQRKTAGVYETNWLDFGNCKTAGYKPDVQRAEHMKSDLGFKRVDLSRVKSIKPLFQFELDEITPELERFRQLAAAGDSATQASGSVSSGSPETLVTSDSVKGRTYFTAKQGVSNVVVKVSSTTYTEGTDYSVDYGAGAITILPGSTIPDGSTVTVSYDYAQVVTKTFTSYEELITEGRFKFIEKDSVTSVPHSVTTFEGQCYVSNWGENATDDYNVTTLDCLPLTDPVVSRRVN